MPRLRNPAQVIHEKQRVHPSMLNSRCEVLPKVLLKYQDILRWGSSPTACVQQSIYMLRNLPELRIIISWNKKWWPSLTFLKCLVYKERVKSNVVNTLIILYTVSLLISQTILWSGWAYKPLECKCYGTGLCLLCSPLSTQKPGE